MATVLGFNEASLIASKNLIATQNRLSESVKNLSSGLRIHSASDDAAGLGLVTALSQQINGANQGIRNLNIGISVVQTAESAIAAAQEMAQRILTLATQGVNSTLGSSERTSIKSEMAQLLSAIETVRGRTKFSGNTLLNIDIKESEITSQFSFQASHQITDIVSLSSNGFKNIGGSIATTSTTGAATQYTLLTGADTTIAAGTKVYKLTQGGSGTGTYTLIGTVSSITSSTLTLNSTASSSVTSTDKLIFNTGLLTDQISTTAGDLSLIQAVSSTTNDAADFQMVQRAATSYITALSSQRSLLGSYQNQIQFTVNNVTDLSLNLSAAKSRVQDADYAYETANLTKGKILQELAVAVLAQANQMPNLVLSLLK